MQRVRASIINIAIVVSLALLVIYASTTTYGLGNKAPDMNELDSQYVLVFQEFVFNIPVQKFVEVAVNMRTKEFSPPKKIDDARRIGDAPSSLGNMTKAVIDLCRNVGEVITLLDVSPDKRWVAVSCKTKLTRRDDGEVVYTNRGCLVDIKNGVMAKKLPTIDPCYFSIDSMYCFFKEGWDIKRMNLFSGEISKIADATSFFLLPDRDRLILFNNGEICFSKLDGRKITTVGEHKHLAYTSGIINSEWGYFMTSRSSKGGKKELFFINLISQQIIRYPHKMPEARLLRIVREKG